MHNFDEELFGEETLLKKARNIVRSTVAKARRTKRCT
jgi:hypothetical protein